MEARLNVSSLLFRLPAGPEGNVDGTGYGEKSTQLVFNDVFTCAWEPPREKNEGPKEVGRP